MYNRVQCVSIGTAIIAVAFIHVLLGPSVVAAAGGVETTRDGLVTLDDSTHKNFIISQPSVLILYYAPWCHWCHAFLPDYSGIAAMVKSLSLSVQIAQIDEAKYRTSNSVAEFPTLILYLDSFPHKYPGEFRSAEIIKWLTERLNTDIIISEVSQLKAVLESHQEHPILIAHFDKDKHADHRKAFISLSKKLENVAFAEVDDRKVISTLVDTYRAPRGINQMSEFLVLINPHYRVVPNSEEPAVLYSGNLEESPKVEAFLKRFMFPTLVEFNEVVAPRLFQDGRPIFVLFIRGEKEALENKIAMDTTRVLGAKFREKMIFVVSPGETVFDKRLETSLGIEGDEKFPTVRLIVANPEGHSTWYSLLKYRPTTEVLEKFDVNGLEQFIVLFRANKLTPHVRSEPVPLRDDAPVKTLVASQFDTVYKSTKDVLVEFYAPWCGHCHTFTPVYNQLGKILGSLGYAVVMKMDSTRNEVPLTILGYPTLILFTYNEETGDNSRMHYYDGMRTLGLILEWLSQHGRVKFNAEAVSVMKLPEAVLSEEL